MSKPRIAPAPPTLTSRVKASPTPETVPLSKLVDDLTRVPRQGVTIPLADVSITWTPVRRFTLSDKATTITGRQLAVGLQVLATILPRSDWDKIGDPEEIAIEAEGLSDIAHLLGCVDDYESSIAGGVKGAFWSLAKRMRELAAQADAVPFADQVAASATVTIITPRPASVSS